MTTEASPALLSEHPKGSGESCSIVVWKSKKFLDCRQCIMICKMGQWHSQGVWESRNPIMKTTDLFLS